MIEKISKSQVLDRIKFENSWWVNGQIDEDYFAMHRRLYFEVFKPIVFETDIKRAVVLMGPRRVGKMVMMYHSIQELIDQGVSPTKIIFITVENPIYTRKIRERSGYLSYLSIKILLVYEKAFSRRHSYTRNDL